MENLIDKTDKTLGYLKNYIVPFLVFICGLVIAWTILQSDVKANTLANERLESKIEIIEAYTLDTNSRLVRIETHLEQIFKILDK